MFASYGSSDIMYLISENCIWEWLKCTLFSSFRWTGCPVFSYNIESVDNHSYIPNIYCIVYCAESVSTFKDKIRKWKPIGCTWRLCKTYSRFRVWDICLNYFHFSFSLISSKYEWLRWSSKCQMYAASGNYSTIANLLDCFCMPFSS